MKEMQNQATTNLQQQQANLQPTGSGLQQNSAGSLTPGSASTLNQAPAKTQQLTVAPLGSPNTAPQPPAVEPSGASPWLWLLLIPVVLIGMYLWPQPKETTVQAEPESPAPQPKQAPRGKKKQTRRKRTSKR